MMPQSLIIKKLQWIQDIAFHGPSPLNRFLLKEESTILEAAKNLSAAKGDPT